MIYVGQLWTTLKMNSCRIRRCLEYAVCLQVHFMTMGVLLAFGTFLPYILDKYGESRSKSSIVNALMSGVAMVTGVFSGALIKKVGTGVTLFIGAVCLASGFILSYFATELVMLYATIGVLSGIGASFTYVGGVVSTGRLFEGRRRTVFLSIQSAAGGIGGVVLPYLLDWFVHLYGLNGAFLVTGGIYLNMVGCAIVLHYSTGISSIHEEEGQLEKKGIDVVNISMTSVTFVSLLMCTTTAMSNTLGICSVIMDIMTFKQLSHSEGLLCLVIYNVSTSIFRFLPILINLCSNNPLFTLSLSTTFGLVGSFTVLMSPSFPVTAFGTAAIGASDGALMASLPIIVFKLVVQESQPFAYGLLLTTIGAIATGMGPLYGGIYDITKSYSPVLIASSSIYLVSLMFAIVCIWTYRRLQNRTDSTKLSYKINEGFEMTTK